MTVTYDYHIKNALVLPMNEQHDVMEHTSIFIKDEKIAYIGLTENCKEFSSLQTFDASSYIVMPPFFNAHTHVAMTLLRGLGSDVPLQEWIEKFIWPLEAAYIDADSVYLGSLLGGIEQIKSGTSTFADMYFFEDQVGQASQALGMRAVLGEALLDFPTPHSKNPTEGFEISKKLLAKYGSSTKHSLSIPGHAPYTCSDDLLKDIAKFSLDHGVATTIHLSETKYEVEQSLKEKGKSPVEHLANLGFFDNWSVCYHCNHLINNDIQILKEFNVQVVTNPNSNMKLASGIAPIPELLQAGVNVAIGTDGAASNNNLSVLNELQNLARLQKLSHQDPTVINARDILKIATINGAKAYQMGHKIGSLELGKQADMIFVQLNAPHMQPLYDPYAQMVYSAESSDIEHMLIDGEFIMKDSQIQHIDENEVLAKVTALCKTFKY